MLTFNVLKVSQSRAIIDRFCQDEGFELTYYIETLFVISIIRYKHGCQAIIDSFCQDEGFELTYYIETLL